MTSEVDPCISDVGVIALVPDEWEGCWQSRHHVLRHLAKFFHVVWMNPAKGWREHWLDPSVHTAAPRSDSNPPGLTIYTPGKWEPQFYKPRMLGAWMARKRLRHARALLMSKGCKKVVLYLWRPEFADACAQIPHDISCYHIDDEYSFSPVELPQDRGEARLIASVDQVFIHSAYLWKRKGHLNANTQFLPNGVDYQAYTTPRPEPVEMQSIPHPRIGYVGKVKTQLDLPLLLTLSSQHPEWSFVFVGPEGYLGQDAPLLDQLRRRSNVFMLGSRDDDQLPGYMQHMDVCLLCYKIDGYTKFIFPLKLNEYLASGSPVVGATLPSLEQFRHVIELARTPLEWETTISRALAIENSDAQQVARRRLAAAPYDWSKLVNLLALRLCERLGPQYVEQFQHQRQAPSESFSTSRFLEQTLYQGLAVHDDAPAQQEPGAEPSLSPPSTSSGFSRQVSA